MKKLELTEEEVHSILDWCAIAHSDVLGWTPEESELERKIRHLLMEEVKVEHEVEQRGDDVHPGAVYGHCTR